MQKTEKIALNLIESTDAFSPEPLNENTRIIADALAEKGTCTVYADSFIGDGNNGRKFDLGFYPKLVILVGTAKSFGSIGMLTRDYLMYTYSGGTYSNTGVAMTETGFCISDSKMFNQNGYTTRYIAFT